MHIENHAVFHRSLPHIQMFFPRSFRSVGLGCAWVFRELQDLVLIVHLCRHVDLHQFLTFLNSFQSRHVTSHYPCQIFCNTPKVWALNDTQDHKASITQTQSDVNKRHVQHHMSHVTVHFTTRETTWLASNQPNTRPETRGSAFWPTHKGQRLQQQIQIKSRSSCIIPSKTEKRRTCHFCNLYQ